MLEQIDLRRHFALRAAPQIRRLFQNLALRASAAGGLLGCRLPFVVLGRFGSRDDGKLLARKVLQRVLEFARQSAHRLFHAEDIVPVFEVTQASVQKALAASGHTGQFLFVLRRDLLCHHHTADRFGVANNKLEGEIFRAFEFLQSGQKFRRVIPFLLCLVVAGLLGLRLRLLARRSRGFISGFLGF